MEAAVPSKRHGGARGAAAVLVLFATLAARGATPQAQGPPTTSEYEVKAAFLFNFAKFVEWPEASLPADGTFVIGLIGADPFRRSLDELDGKQAIGRRIVVRRGARLEEVWPCQILFISASEEERLATLLQAMTGRPVLTVGDTDGWAERGVLVNFKTRERRVRFEINLERAELAGLKLSSQLLKLATLVGARTALP